MAPKGMAMVPSTFQLNHFICSSCRAAHRPRNFPLQPSPRLSSSSQPRKISTTAPPPPPPASGFALLQSRRLISLKGPDASHFLQGVITANISPAAAARTSGFYTAFLNAQGRVLHDVFLYPLPDTDGWLIEVDADEAERLYKHVRRYKLRAKFDVRLLAAGEMGVWSVWRDGGAWTPHTIGGGAEGEEGCVDARAPGMGRRVVLASGQKPEAEDGLEEVGEGAYTLRRYLKGVAEGQREIMRETALPQESNVDIMGGIDYRKGCYVGQELTIRTHHTGVVRKRILPVMLYEPDEAVPRALVYKPDAAVEPPPLETSISRVAKKGRSAGKWLCGMGNIGLSLCRLEIMTDVSVQGEGSTFKEGDEFKFEWEAEDGTHRLVKAKAFVPSWHPAK